MVATNSSSEQRREVISRVIAAILPTFILCNTLGVALVLLLPTDKLTALGWVAFLVFFFYTGVVMWIFHEPSLRKVWTRLTLAIVLSAGAAWGLLVLEGSL